MSYHDQPKDYPKAHYNENTSRQTDNLKNSKKKMINCIHLNSHKATSGFFSRNLTGKRIRRYFQSMGGQGQGEEEIKWSTKNTVPGKTIFQK